MVSKGRKRGLCFLLALTVVMGLMLPGLGGQAWASNFWSEIEVDPESFFMGFDEPTALMLDELDTKIQYPDDSEYLDELVLAYVKLSSKDGRVRFINSYTSPSADKVEITIQDGSPVVLLAQSENFYCAIDPTRNKACWIQDKNLDVNYYGFYDEPCADLAAELDSWEDLASIHVARGSVVGLQEDGTVLCAKYAPWGKDFSNWGKLKSFYRGLFGIGLDGSIRMYADFFWSYPRPVSEEDQSEVALTDCRYIQDAQDILFCEDVEILLSDGKLNLMGFGMVYERPYGLDESYLFYDRDRKCWCYVESSYEGKTLYVQGEDGSFDRDSGKDVTGRPEYEFTSIAEDLVDISGGVYPTYDGFLGLKKTGELLIYGDYTTASIMGDMSSQIDYSFLEDYLDVDALIDYRLFIKDGKIRCLGTSQTWQWDFGSFYSSSDIGDWDDIAAAVTYYDDILLAVTTKGRVEIENIRGDSFWHFDEEEFQAVKDELAQWRDVVYVTMGLPYSWYEDNLPYIFLGVTRSGEALYFEA